MPDDATAVPSLEYRARSAGLADPRLLAEIAAAERIAGAQALHVASNGRFPRWSFERWVMVLGFAASLFLQVFYSGRAFERFEARVQALEFSRSEYARKDVVDAKLDALKAVVDGVAAVLKDRPR